MDNTCFINRIVAETIDRYINNIITESQESKSIDAAKKLYMKRTNKSKEEADEFVRIKLRNDIPSLRKDASKFILGVARMFLDGEIRNASTISQLNTTLKFVSSDAHINEYDRNLNNLSAQDLIQRFAQAVTDDVEMDKREIAAMKFNGESQYDIVRIDSFEQASKYGVYVDWCVTHHKNMFNSYTSDGINQFYFCLKNGFEKIPKKCGEECPLDEYGLSMIAICVDENGRLNTCTCRWNHDNGGNDSIMSTKQISEAVEVNFYQTFKPNNKWKDMLANVQQRLANGEDIEDIFKHVVVFHEGFADVKLGKKWNFINQNGKLISNQWFDNVGYFYKGLALVALNEKWNFINQNGELISNQWFDDADDFCEGFAMVALNGKYNFINQNGEFLSSQWFDIASRFNHEGFAQVMLNGKRNFINQNGEFLSNQWFQDADDFCEGFARVKLNKKYNFINQNGELISNQWFDDAGDFHEGFAVVILNSEYNILNKQGELISNQWFDDADDMNYKGCSLVMLNGKCNFINKQGKLMFNQWFDIKERANKWRELSTESRF